MGPFGILGLAGPPGLKVNKADMFYVSGFDISSIELLINTPVKHSAISGNAVCKLCVLVHSTVTIFF